MHGWFIGRKNHQVVGVPEIIPDTFNLFDPMIKISEIEVRKVLAKVVANGETRCAVDDLVQQPEQVLVLEFSA